MALAVPVPGQQEGASPRLEDQSFELPDPYVERMRARGRVLELSLKDAIRLALTNNLEIAIEDYNEDLNREQIIAARGFYDPILSFQVSWNSVTRPVTSILDSGRGIPTRIFKGLRLNTRVEQPVIGGGTAALDFNNFRSSSNSAFTFINPNFDSSVDFSFTQPLWRGFRQTPTERQIKLLNLDTKITDSQFQQRVAEIVQRVQNQYWELVFAIERYETQRGAMQLAIVQHENSRKRVEIGVQAPIEITSTRAEVARNEQSMIQSEVSIVQAENGLKQMLAADPRDTLWNLNLIPTARPEMSQLQVTLDQATQTALERRPELEQLRLQVEKQQVDRNYYLKDGKPQVNFIGNLATTGTAGQVFQSVLADRDGDGVPETPVGQAPNPNSPFFGNFADSIWQSLGFNYLNWTVGVNVQFNLRNRTNEAQLAQIALQERQHLGRMKNQQQLIMVDVRNAYQGIEIQRKRWEAAQLQSQLSQEKLVAENKRYEAGLSTNFQVLQAQRDLADAQVAELRALIDYQLAVTDLQKAMYTIIDENDIVLARENGTQ